MLIKSSLLSLIFIFYSNLITIIIATSDHYVEIINDKKYLTSNKLHDDVRNYSSDNSFLNGYQNKSKELNEIKHTGISKRSTNEKRPRQRARIGNCQKVDFNVNFVELGWDKWILFPKIFNAHLCSGDCSLPLKSHRKKSYFSYSSASASESSSSSLSSITESESTFTSSVVQVTNHAQIMSILEFKHPDINKHMTKCVSTKLKPLTVVFLDEFGQIKTKQYQDMIVEECGCR